MNSACAPKSQRIVSQNSSMTCRWDLLWTLHRYIAPKLIGFNTYLDADIATIYICSNIDLAEIYFRELSSQNNIELSKATIFLNIPIKRHLDFLIYWLATSPFLTLKQSYFTSFLSKNKNHAIYKAYNITTITEILENCNSPSILNPYFYSS